MSHGVVTGCGEVVGVICEVVVSHGVVVGLAGVVGTVAVAEEAIHEHAELTAFKSFLQFPR